MFTVREIQHIKQLLRNVAEVDPDDRISNCASQLAVDLETPHKINNLTETEQAMIRYAHSKRNVYVLAGNAKHATNISKEIA